MMTTDLPPIDWRSLLETLFGVAVAAAHPKLCLPENLPNPDDYENIFVIAAGKAAASSANILEAAWPDHDITGIAISPNVAGVVCDRIDLVETGHTVPDIKTVAASQKALAIAREAGADDLLLILLSDGASSCLTAPVDGISLPEKQNIISTLSNAGASGHDIDIVQKHLSSIKGGQLALAGANAKKIVTLAISNIIGDDPGVIGSGVSYFDATNIDDARTVLEKYNLSTDVPFIETLKADHPVASKLEYKLIANPQVAINTAANLARNLGFTPTILSISQAGDAEFTGKTQARFIEKLFKRGRDKPKLFLAGGEYMMPSKGRGQGGPNQHFLLSLLHHMPKDLPLYALSADTGGHDGTGKAAGAWITPETRYQMDALGLDTDSYLRRGDSYGFFSKLGSVIHAQPTHTSINDFRAYLIPPTN